jgi:hypothetical protein
MINFNIDLLNDIIIRDKCIIELHKYDNLTRNVNIEFICVCGNISNKIFRTLYKFGSFCKKCTENNRLEKIKNSKSNIDIEKMNIKIKETIKKLNEKNPERMKQIISKRIKTVKKLNEENPDRLNKINNKVKNTNLKKFGFEIPMHSEIIKNKSKEVFLEKYGVENPFQSEEIKKKCKETSIKNYGVEYALQNSEYSERLTNNYKYKLYKFPCGNEIKIQGYENLALDVLVSEGFTYNDIKTSRNEVPEVWYNDLVGKKHRYFVDIWIPKINKMVEVKSTWTYNKNINIVNLKKQKCKELGYDYEIWIYKSSKNKNYLKD